MRKFCLLLNEKKEKIKELKLNGVYVDESESSEESFSEEEESKSAQALDPNQVLSRLQELAAKQS